jgi:hypothetical protein
MRTYILTLVILLSCDSYKPVKSGYIKFENVGNSDKPLTTLLISTRDFPDKDFQRVIVVDIATFNVLYKFVDEREDRYRGKRDGTKWFAFEVSTRGNNLIGSYLLPSQEKSIKFFNELLVETEKIKSAKGIDTLQYELKILLKRIST